MVRTLEVREPGSARWMRLAGDPAECLRADDCLTDNPAGPQPGTGGADAEGAPGPVHDIDRDHASPPSERRWGPRSSGDQRRGPARMSTSARKSPCWTGDEP